MTMNWLVKLRDKLFGIDKIRYQLQQDALRNEQTALFKLGEIKALEILKPYLPDGYLFETGFSMSFQAIQHILNDIVIHKPKLILEFGSGLSTQIIANFLERNRLESKLYSIDDNKEWQESLGLNGHYATCLTFPITENNPYSYGQTGKWFAIPAINELADKKFDLIVVDAPKGNLCKYSRYGFIPFVKNLLSESPILYVDDSGRPDEEYIVSLARQEFGDLAQSLSTPRYTRLSRKEEFYTMPS